MFPIQDAEPGGFGARYSERYSDPAATAKRQHDLVTRWGAAVGRGSTVLELGCADGFSTEYMTKRGLRVTGVDASPAMLDAATERFLAAGREPAFLEADVNQLELESSYDVVLGLMRTFCRYVEDQAATIARLAARTRVKLLVDVNPRETAIDDAVAAMHGAGFRSVTWRAFFVPQHFRIPPVAQPVVRVAERTPVVRDVVLRRKFVAVVKGEWT